MDKQKRKGYSNNKSSYYNKRSRQYSLETGMTGFLCTCNFREKECVRDAYRILELFANELYGSNGEAIEDPQMKIDTKDDEKNTSEDATVKVKDDDEEDISDALNKELAELKAETKKSPSAKKFQSVDAGVKNVIFISTTLPNPLELVLSILKKLDETKQQITRFVLRLLPIQVICKANIPEIKINADKLFEKYFSQEPKTFSIVFNRHCNDKIQRAEIIEELAALVSKKNPGNKADLTSPQIAVVVEIIRGYCLLSIAPDYFKYKKYNLLELCNVKEPEKPLKEKAADSESRDEELSAGPNDEETKNMTASKSPRVVEVSEEETTKV